MGKELPNKAIVPLKDEKEWIILDDSFEFKFSLYMDDLVELKKDSTCIIGYFAGTDRSTGAIVVEYPDRSKKYRVGVKTQDYIKNIRLIHWGTSLKLKAKRDLV